MRAGELDAYRVERGRSSKHQASSSRKAPNVKPQAPIACRTRSGTFAGAPSQEHFWSGGSGAIHEPAFAGGARLLPRPTKSMSAEQDQEEQFASKPGSGRRRATIARCPGGRRIGAWHFGFGPWDALVEAQELPAALGIEGVVLELGVWSFSGAWSLRLGASGWSFGDGASGWGWQPRTQAAKHAREVRRRRAGDIPALPGLPPDPPLGFAGQAFRTDQPVLVLDRQPADLLATQHAQPSARRRSFTLVSPSQVWPRPVRVAGFSRVTSIRTRCPTSQSVRFVTACAARTRSNAADPWLVPRGPIPRVRS